MILNIDGVMEEGEGGSSQRKHREAALDIEGVAESLEAVILFIAEGPNKKKREVEISKSRKWMRKKDNRKLGTFIPTLKVVERGKRQLVEVQITEGFIEDIWIKDRKRRQSEDVEMIQTKRPDMVLEEHHHLAQ